MLANLDPLSRRAIHEVDGEIYLVTFGGSRRLIISEGKDPNTFTIRTVDGRLIVRPESATTMEVVIDT